THDVNGVVIDTDREIADGVGPLVGATEGYAKIVDWLDQGYADLMSPDAAFSFPLSKGFQGFDSPTTFAKFNRALKARVAVYTKQYDVALAALQQSFLDTDSLTLLKLEVGAYNSYSTAAGDAPNNLINPNIFANPGIL